MWNDSGKCCSGTMANPHDKRCMLVATQWRRVCHFCKRGRTTNQCTGCGTTFHVFCFTPANGREGNPQQDAQDMEEDEEDEEDEDVDEDDPDDQEDEEDEEDEEDVGDEEHEEDEEEEEAEAYVEDEDVE